MKRNELTLGGDYFVSGYVGDQWQEHLYDTGRRVRIVDTSPWEDTWRYTSWGSNAKRHTETLENGETVDLRSNIRRGGRSVLALAIDKTTGEPIHVQYGRPVDDDVYLVVPLQQIKGTWDDCEAIRDRLAEEERLAQERRREVRRKSDEEFQSYHDRLASFGVESDEVRGNWVKHGTYVGLTKDALDTLLVILSGARALLTDDEEEATEDVPR